MKTDNPSSNPPNKQKLTTAETDSESGNEGLSKEDDLAKSKKALKIMLDKGLLSQTEYDNRLEELVLNSR